MGNIERGDAASLLVEENSPIKSTMEFVVPLTGVPFDDANIELFNTLVAVVALTS